MSGERLAAAVAELVEALRAELATEAPPSAEVERLLDVPAACQALSIGRTRLYAEIDAGRLRSLSVGRRRLIPASAIADYARRER